MASETEIDPRPAGVRLPDASRAAELQRRWTAAWHDEANEPSRGPGAAAESFEGVLEQEHRANFELWHAEDVARDPRASDAEVAGVKRRIDGCNQRRNDLIERLDEGLLEAAGRTADEAVPLHSETPGMMLDRMSILALKIFHTEEQIARRGASEAHRRWNRERLKTLEEQRTDLTRALRDLLAAVAGGERRFKVYRQMKMYNDPTLNPRIYNSNSVGGDVVGGDATAGAADEPADEGSDEA